MAVLPESELVFEAEPELALLVVAAGAGLLVGSADVVAAFELDTALVGVALELSVKVVADALLVSLVTLK